MASLASVQSGKRGRVESDENARRPLRVARALSWKRICFALHGFPSDALSKRDLKPFVEAQGWARTNPMTETTQPNLESSTTSARTKWRTRVQEALRSLGGEATLQAIYRAVEEHFPEVRERKHWKAKVRQVLQADPQIERIENGAWRHCPMSKDSHALKSE